MNQEGFHDILNRRGQEEQGRGEGRQMWGIIPIVFRGVTALGKTGLAHDPTRYCLNKCLLGLSTTCSCALKRHWTADRVRVTDTWAGQLATSSVSHPAWTRGVVPTGAMWLLQADV